VKAICSDAAATSMADVDHPGSGSRTLADLSLSLYPSMNSGIRAVQSVVQAMKGAAQ
jgi:hypothetical protein